MSNLSFDSAAERVYQADLERAQKLAEAEARISQDLREEFYAACNAGKGRMRYVRRGITRPDTVQEQSIGEAVLDILGYDGCAALLMHLLKEPTQDTANTLKAAMAEQYAMEWAERIAEVESQGA